MCEIYKGNNLSICYETGESLFIQKWIISPKKVSDFKNEMLAYTKMYEKYKPSNTLWLQQNFTLNIDDETKIWLEKNVNAPCLSYGNKKCAFVVSKDVLAHITIMDSFDEVQSCIEPKHFANELEARKWLNSEFVKNKNENKKIEITYKGVDTDGKAVIEFKNSASDIADTIKSFKTILQENEFIKCHINKYALLSKREKQVLKNIGEGKKHQQIADDLFISIHTVRDHIKNIKQKLDINNSKELLIYYTAFIKK